MKQKRRGGPLRWILWTGAILLLLMFIVPRGPGAQEIDISRVIQMAVDGDIEQIEVKGDSLDVTAIGGEVFKSRKEAGVSILRLLEEKGVVTGPGGVGIEVKSDGGGLFSTRRVVPTRECHICRPEGLRRRAQLHGRV